MKKIQGTLRDEQLNLYRIESFQTKSDFLSLIKTLVDFTKGDEEPYQYPVETEEEVTEFLELYGYSFTPLSDKQLEQFESLAYNSDGVANRLSKKETILFDAMLATDYTNVPTI